MRLDPPTEQWVKGVCPPPARVQYHITNRCNLRCIFCWQYSNSEKLKELPDEKWFSISREACEVGVKRITLSGGGEPFLRPKTICGIIDIAKSHGLEMEIITNGTLITSELAEKIVKSGLDDIIFSVHSSDSKLDEIIRGGEAPLEKTIQSINLINYWKEKIGTNKPKMKFFMVITRHNYNGIYDMAKLMEKLKVEGLVLREVNGTRAGSETGVFMKKEHLKDFLSDIEKAKEFGKSHGVEIKEKFIVADIVKQLGIDIQQPKREEISLKKSGTYCQFPFTEMVIFANGKTSQCCNFFGVDDEVMDDITNRTLIEVWYGKPFERLRKAIIDKAPIPRCVTCSIDFMSENLTSPE